MPGKYLLDTNIVINFFRNPVLIQARLTQADEVYASSIVIGELYFGAYKSNLTQANLAQIATFVANNEVLNCDLVTARQFGIIKAQLQAKGRMIPENDIWIAAATLQHGLTLATRDAHFKEVANLSYEVW